ncbi:RICIN domain-containing protein [Lentzea sp.]|uniref:RICIN domain-containing protein n=1 Tax=Lentzea sp. TaxID=56099 RepID=UPI002C962B1F|nr:ricin-type beta-trefoil lectin domain protein [Lentzea sp.]HUQ59484.1 ricin-type beta-trefoil lectin domain protein [Lentzea sp.]
MRATLRLLAGAGVSVALLALAAPGAATAQEDALTTIKHPVTGRCVTADAASTVLTLDCTGADTQKWDISTTPGRFQNVGDGRCLASDGSVVFTMSCTSQTTWRIVMGTPKRIVHVPTGGCLQNGGGDGERLRVGPCARGTAWQF